MKLSRRHFAGAAATGIASLVAPGAFAAIRSDDQPTLLGRARAALDAHGSRIPHRDVVGLVDFGVSSGVPRFQIVDLEKGRVMANWLVAHGRGSDPANTGLVQKFSNRPGSNASSRGSFLVGDTYFGKHGRSRQLHGLDGDNDMAFERAIVIHGARYVSSALSLAHGRIGRSLGCFAVSNRTIGDVLDQLCPGRLLFAAR